MQKIIAYCGLICSDCPTFLATLNDDDTAREKTAVFYSKTYGLNLKPEDINCNGCTSDTGKLIGYCHTCAIRKCCREQGLANCAVCSTQPCEELQKFHTFSPVAKSNFDNLLKEMR